MNTRRNILAGLILSVCIAAPVAAGALSIDDLQAQVKSLLARISAMQVQGGASTEPTPISVTAVPRICMLDFAGSLQFGSRGEGVRGLQEFLKNEGVLSAEATGYFGLQTQAALQKWQASQGVVSSGSARTSGWGVLGPATRARINARCGTANLISVSPSSGSAPLTVKVTSQVGDSGTYRPSIVDGQDTLIDFGDGSERQWVNCSGTLDDRYGTMCSVPQTYTHTYAQNGTYTVSLVKAGGMCMGGCPERLLGTAYVTVGGTANQQLDASPQSGAAPLTVQFSYTPSNDDSAQYYIEYGDGQGQLMDTRQIYCIRAPCISPKTAVHTYTASGDYTATVSRYIACLYSNPRCMIAQPAPLASVVIHVTGNTGTGNRAPVISSVSAPSTLAVNQTGTWTINAYDPENGQLTYNMWWGDENVYAPTMSGAAASRDFTQTTTFTHAYANAGTYTVTMTVRDAAGLQAQSSATVRVGSEGVACTMQYQPVCGRAPGCMNTCAPGMYCTMMCRLPEPQTYGNRCALNAAGAEYLYEGECRAN